MRRAVFWLLLLAVGGCGRGDAPPEDAREAAGVGAGALTAPAASDGDVHLVRLLARGDRYAFEPAEVRIRPGAVVRFVQTGYEPESIRFDLSQVPAEAAALLAEQDVLHGPLLTEPGVFFDVAFVDAPPGVYPFHSVAHREQGMEGRVVVEAAQ